MAMVLEELLGLMNREQQRHPMLCAGWELVWPKPWLQRSSLVYAVVCCFLVERRVGGC